MFFTGVWLYTGHKDIQVVKRVIDNRAAKAALLMILCAVAPAVGAQLSYLNEIARQCQKHYFPPADAITGAGEVSCELLCDGKVQDVKVVAGPKYKRTDLPDDLGYAALKEAVVTAAPFKAAPNDFRCPARLLIVFDQMGKASVKVQNIISRASTEK